jgi:serine phosphatase RsbU (regulator of sigma subunit)
MNDRTAKNSGYVLVISKTAKTVACIEEILSKERFITVVASDTKQAKTLLVNNQISYIFIDEDLVNGNNNELISSLRFHIGDSYIPIVILASNDDEELLSHCISASCDDFLFMPFTSVALNTKIASLEQLRELKKLHKSSVNEQLVAMQILTSALEQRSVRLDEIKLLSRSKAVFSGDLFLTARHPDGSLNVLLADFTGHGLSASIGALPIADIFSVMTEKGFELDYILECINGKMHNLLPTSMFMACCVLNIDKDLRQVRAWNGGMPDICIREHNTGFLKHKIKSTHIPLGINETILDRFEFEDIEITPGDQLILYTDGMTEALNAEGEMFGDQRLEQCLQQNHSKESIFPEIVDAFNKFCGDINPMDDVTLAYIPCVESLMHVNDIDVSKNIQYSNSRDQSWCWYMELGGSSLCEVNPVPIVLNAIHKISGHSACTDKLSSIMSVLYKNVIEHDASSLNNINLQDINIINNDICNNIENIDGIYIRIGIRKVEHNGCPALLVRMEDSGKGIDEDELLSFINDNCEISIDKYNKGFPLVYELHKLNNYQGAGNRLEAIICDRF